MSPRSIALGHGEPTEKEIISRADEERWNEALALAARRDLDIIEAHLFRAGRDLAAATERACRVRLQPETTQLAALARQVIDMDRRILALAEERVREAMKP